MAPGRGLGSGDEADEEVRALLREALLRLSALENRLGRVDIQRLDKVDLRREVDSLRTELGHMRESLAGLAEP